jgi:putative MATE family efflux protein
MSAQTAANRRGGIDFTTGVPWKKILPFALPLMFSNILQQLYNTVAGIIVGRGVSHVGLAAVGLSGPYLRVLTSLFMGVAMGGNVLIAQYFGAKDKVGLRRTVHTAIVLSLSVGLTLSVIGIAAVPMILRLTGVPEEVFPMAQTYMRILFSGIVFQMTYNMLASFLRGMGDSRTQLYILAVTSVVNAGLCWAFVIYFKWGVAGAGWATVLSQLLSCIIIFVKLQKSDWTRVVLKELRIYGVYLKELLRIGLPTAVQQVVMSLANTIVMGFVTGYGTESIAGYSAGSSLEMYVTMPVSAMNMSVTPFAAQNIGAGNLDRVHKAAKQTIIINTVTNLLLSVIMLTFSKPLLGLFTENAATISAGVVMLTFMVPTHIFNAVTQPLSGVIRGSGDPIMPMVNSLLMVAIVRIPTIIILNAVFGRIEVVYLSQTIANIVGIVQILYVYKRGKWKQKAIARIEVMFPPDRQKDEA